MNATETEVRQWGIGLGLPVAAKGKLPRGLVDRWNRAHPDRPFVDTRGEPANGAGLAVGAKASAARARGQFTPERAAAIARRRSP